MSQILEGALINPDDNAACQSLHLFLSKGTITNSETLPTTTKACLEAFCKDNRSVARRRWTGLALAKVIESRPQVLPHLQHAPGDLARVGTVILESTETEEIKIVAGLIIRAGLSNGIEFADFWAVEKVHTTAKCFPKDADTRWMEGFQDYLDTLSALIPLGGPPSQLSIEYPLALIATDGYKWWKGHDEGFPILLIESHAVTIITPEPALRNMQFICIPKRSIQDLKCQPYDAYDSQDRQSLTRPWQVVLKLRTDFTSYEVNCQQRIGDEFAILLQDDKKAKECGACIKEILLAREPSGHDNAKSGPSREGDSCDETTNNEASALSKGGVVEFRKSQREANTLTAGAQTHQFASEDADEARSKPAQTKRGALPAIKKSLDLNGTASGQDTAQTDYEFPDHSPSIKRSTLAKPKKPFSSRKQPPVPRKTLENSARPNPTASRLNTKNQHVTESDDAAGVQHDDDSSISGISDGAEQESKPISLSRISKSGYHQAGRSRRQVSDVFGIPQDTQEEEQGVQRGVKRTRARAVKYKEGSSPEEDSDSDFTENRKTKKPRGRPSKTTSKKDASKTSPAKAAGSRKPVQTKSSTQRLHPLKGSLLANLQSEPNAKRSRNGRASKADAEHDIAQRPPVTVRKDQKTKTTARLEQTDPSSEADILGKLLEAESDDGPNNDQTAVIKAKGAVASTKRPSVRPTPSTTPVKRAKLDHGRMNTNAEAGESIILKPLPPMAPVRVLQDPSSPCHNRAHGSMQAPPKPPIEDTLHAVSPKKHHRTGRSQKQIDERQTPVHQLSKRTQSGMSGSVEILSSNSKRTPASPRAASTAISGHADEHQVIMEKEIAEHKIEKSDPFRFQKPKANAFLQRLAGGRTASQSHEEEEGSSQRHPIALGDSPSSFSSEAFPPTSHSPAKSDNHTGITQPVEMLEIRAPDRARPVRSRPIQEPSTAVVTETSAYLSQAAQHARREEAGVHSPVDNTEMEGNTLVDLEEPQLPGSKASAMQLRSSPPPMDNSPSSHSSTSAEPEPKTDSPVPASEAEEMEWESSLRPYQRDLKDQLFRVSNRVLRHIVDNETAVSDIADTYAKDGQHSLDLLLQDHEKEFDAMRKDVRQKKAKMNNASEKMLSRLRRERQGVLDDE
ncbi:hypothetical protein BU23DRAFT_181055 [Bimuria novae-zelandiae CBS 107.79]|uniref:Uncharacterized protein n=1 Tax=Bimuria novae-zelandiae CBS 107.79 TaxID=1447943 RepID=A0A6A5VDU2_9PLEO|nr:hypothetical protein BU23DRAFT_181055 [Bimuria novae-zelandiae CBS 107.79]